VVDIPSFFRIRHLLLLAARLCVLEFVFSILFDVLLLEYKSSRDAAKAGEHRDHVFARLENYLVLLEPYVKTIENRIPGCLGM
jgi:hypothetical protein